jgi:hypothetical protein
MKAVTTQPTVSVVTSTSSANESAGSAPVAVQLTTPTGTALACPVTVSYSIYATGATGTDFQLKQGTLTFAAGTASGATQNATITITNDATDEPNEIVSLGLTGATGGVLGTSVQHTVTIVDDDAPPSLTINDVTLSEGAGVATFTISLSAASAFPVSVTVGTSPSTALTPSDFTSMSAVLTIPAGQTSATYSIPVIDDAWAEPTEGFFLSMQGPVNATIARVAGVATILDNEPARVPINPALPGTYFPDVTTLADTASYLPIYNPHSIAVTARLTFTKPNGAGITRDVSVPAQQRITLDLAGEPNIAGQGDVSVVVQSLDTARPLVAESSHYWQTDWRGGRNTAGVTQPSPGWIFGEGATGFYDEYVTIYNVTNTPIDANIWLYPTSGFATYQKIAIPTGPGRIKVHVNDILANAEHGTLVLGTDAAGTQVPIVVERTMYWGSGDRREGHSANGVNGGYGTYLFAEGATGGYSTFIALMNPFTTASNVELNYLHENGVEYHQTATIPAQQRLTLSPPSAMPAGSFAVGVTTTNGVGFVADRAMYSGVNFKVGDAETGSPYPQVNSTRWLFAEGASTAYFSGWLLLGNFNATTANVTLTFRLNSGGTVTSTTTVPARGRRTIDLSSIPGVYDHTFAMEVAVTNGVSIVAERSMYWPASGWQAVHTSLGRPQ